jgi:hypothetical protein
MVGSRRRLAAELVLVALKSKDPFLRRNPAGWRLICLGTIAAALLAAVASAKAEDSQQAVESAVGGDRIQRDRPVAENTEDSQHAIESAVGGDGIQRDRPAGESDAGSKAQSPGDAERTRKSLSDQDPDIQHDPPQPRPDETESRSTGSMNLSWLPYAILAVIGIGLAFVLLRYVSHRFAGRNGAAAKTTVAPAATTRVVTAPEPERDRTFDEVDALAASGAFTEAVHHLLLLVQERLRSRIEHGIQVSLTSREILRRAKLPQEAATAFATLVAAVEVSLFGMRAANAATYALCRENGRRVLASAAERMH